MNIITGDLIELAKIGQFEAILHCCNCFNNFGSGNLFLKINNSKN